MQYSRLTNLRFVGGGYRHRQMTRCRGVHSRTELGRRWQQPLQDHRDPSWVVGRLIDLVVDYEDVFKIYGDGGAHSTRLGLDTVV